MTKKAVQVTDAGDVTGLIVFTFDDETTETFDASKVPQPTRARAEMHGYSQKIGDSYAGAAESSDPLEFAKASVRDTIAQLYAGDWRATVSRPKQTDLAVALSRLTGKTVEESQAFVDTLDDDQKKAWRGKAKVKATLAVIAAEKAAAKAAKLVAGAKESEGEAISIG